uniref:Uncharacterized protein n=1 Tax=Toxoplasma gondii COUG TaxID=1074873 RepID=A0A2G8YEY7_TOXGO|nr:hypothetical protein TGCOUG_391170 [Toxoplasma gondii COUG]
MLLTQKRVRSPNIRTQVNYRMSAQNEREGRQNSPFSCVMTHRQNLGTKQTLLWKHEHDLRKEFRFAEDSRKVLKKETVSSLSSAYLRSSRIRCLHRGRRTTSRGRQGSLLPPLSLMEGLKPQSSTPF